MSDPIRHVVLSWDQIERDAAILAQHVRAAGPWIGIIAVARGGLVPASLLAYRLRLRTLDLIAIDTYQNEIAGDPVVRQAPHEAGDGKGWLIVDDLVDRGTTIKVARRLLPAARVAVLYAKPAGRPLADWAVQDYAQAEWLVFPWERDDVTG